MRRLTRPAPATRPSALRPRYLVMLGVVLAVLLAALAANELRAARQLIGSAMEEGSASLVEALSRAGENAIRADARLEAATEARLLGQARLLRELETREGLSDTALARLAAAGGLSAIQVFDAEGRSIRSTGGREAAGTDPIGGDPDLAAVIDGRSTELVLGYLPGPDRDDDRFAAAVHRSGGGAILVAIDAAEMLTFRQEAGIGRLVQEIGDNPRMVYVVLQDRQGIVLASRNVSRMGRIAGDPFLESCLAGEEPRSRLVEREGRPVFETAMPFWVDPETRGLIRVGIAADAMVVAEARGRRRLAVWAGLLAVVGIAVVGWITVRQNYALLDEAHQRIQTYSSRLLAHLADAVVAVDGQGRIDVLNPAAERLFGVTAPAVRGAPVAQALGQAGELLARSLKAGEEVRAVDCPCRTPDGRSVALSVSLSLIRGRDGEVETGVAVIQDLTERRALEADHRRRERLAAMGELASGVAHEVRNPLNAIAVIAQRLQREFQPRLDEEEYRQLTATVRGEVSRVNLIIRQFLELARPPALALQEVDLSELLAESLRVAESSAAGRRIRIEGEFAGLGPVRLDPVQIKQAVLNLLVNAIEALTGANGSLEPEPVTGRRDAGTVRLAARREPAAVLISVTDDGPGIAAADRERIFDLYYTTKPTGTGLGLSLVQRIVAEHGGRIELDTEVGRGTTFTLYLPLQPPEHP